MHNTNDLLMRIANRVMSNPNSNSLLGLSDESLLKFVKDVASEEALHLSAEVNNADTF